MGGFFGITANYDCVQDVFFGVDYHSHLGKARAGMAAVNKTLGFQREIHNTCVPLLAFLGKHTMECKEMQPAQFDDALFDFHRFQKWKGNPQHLERFPFSRIVKEKDFQSFIRNGLCRSWCR